jgi:ribosomal protein L37AE/L43A
MHIKKIISQHRRDFTAIYKCEHCNEERKGTGYDDTFFHENVVPNMGCNVCDKTASEAYKPLTPKYSQDTVI